MINLNVNQYYKVDVFMILLKAVLAGMAGISLCMANISGIVTDTGTTPITGAVVQLENGKQQATTDSDGRFTLVVGITANLPGNGTLLPNGPSARISGNMVYMTISERAAVEVAAFDLVGKTLLKVRKTMDADSHGIALPRRSAGIYLYTVKAGNNEFVLKGYVVGGIAYGSRVNSQGSSLKSPAKQAMNTAAFNDVIAVTKTGYLNYRMIVAKSDTSGLEIKMIASAGTVTDADGNVYQTVKIGNQVWMAENLRTTKYNDGSAITNLADSAAWANVYNEGTAIPAYCYYKNTTDADKIRNYGALYNWYAVNTGILAPPGWHIPDTTDWNILVYFLIANGYNWDETTTDNKIAKSLAAKTNWLSYSTEGAVGNDLTGNNTSGFSALPGGSRRFNGSFFNFGGHGYWWCSNEQDSIMVNFGYLDYNSIGFYWSGTNYNFGFSVRLLKD
jgi:uncharacterized protein (TIGR02145 family)